MSVSDNITKLKSTIPMKFSLDRLRICLIFYDYLKDNYIMFDKNKTRRIPFINVEHTDGDYVNINDLLARFFGISSEEVNKEHYLLITENLDNKSEYGNDGFID